MPDFHAVILFNIAPQVAEMFRTDPEVAALSDPAVLIDADGDEGVATVLERSELAEILSAATLEEGTSIQEVPDGEGLISILVVDANGASHYRVPDPRIHPDRWPWMGEPEY
jgi:hypothetical protein